MSTITDPVRPAYVPVLLRHFLLLTIGAYCCLGLTLSAQTSNSETTQDVPIQWQSTTDEKSDYLLPERLPMRITEAHAENGDRTLDKRSVEIRGTDRHLEPYQNIERETVKVDSSTTKITVRTFARDVNKRRSLVQVTEEEKHVLLGDDSNVVRVTFNPDVNGKLEAVQREIVETRTIGKDMEETNTTVMLHSVYGGLAPAFKTHEARKRIANNSIETERTTWIPDINGKWQVNEIRKNVTTQEDEDRTVEETVFRPDAEGKLSQISRVVGHQSESPSGEKQTSVETYSIDVPGTTRDGNLHLVERKTSTERSSSSRERTTEQTVEQIDTGNPNSGLRISVLVNGRMVPVSSGEESSVTIRARDSNGNLDIVSVDTTKSDSIPTVQVEQTSAKHP